MQSKELRRIAHAIEASTETPTPRNTGREETRRQKLPLMARLCLAFGGGPKAEQQLRDRLREFPIMIAVGPNGGGKTLCVMVLTEPVRKGIPWECDNPDHLHTAQGTTSGVRRILSTVPILDGEGNAHPLYDEFNDYHQLVDAEHTTIVMDEVVTVASSRESLRMDPRVLAKLVQLRKADCDLLATAPNWARMDKAMREVCQVVIECRGFYPAPHTGDGSPLWRPKRVFHFRAFDSIEFDEWSAAKRDAIKPLRAIWFKGVGSEAFTAYDTLGSVTVLASMTPEDTCTVCDGRVTRHTCQCNKTPRRRPLPKSLDLPAFDDSTMPSTFPGAPTAPEFVDAPA